MNLGEKSIGFVILAALLVVMAADVSAQESAPQDPYYVGYECDCYSSVCHCIVWLKIPETYNETFYGWMDSPYIVMGGTSYDDATRTWTLEVYLEPVAACSDFGVFYAVEWDTGRMLDSMTVRRDCVQNVPLLYKASSHE